MPTINKSRQLRPGLKPGRLRRSLTKTAADVRAGAQAKAQALEQGLRAVESLSKIKVDSHKGDNGRLLIIGGSEQYHGAPWLALSIAAKIVDVVYFSSVPENLGLIKKLKSTSAEFIAVPLSEIASRLPQVEAVLIGPGLGLSRQAGVLVNGLLKSRPKTKLILDADALKLADKRLLTKNCLVTPHALEFKKLFGCAASPRHVRAMAKKYAGVVVLKGVKDYVAGGGQYAVNATGNAGMTKGGTGDVLAGLIAALACTNDLFLAGLAGVFINGLAGDRLFKRVGVYYSAGDLLKEIPRTLKWCQTV